MDTTDERNIRRLLDDYLRKYASRDDTLTADFSEDFSGFTGGGDFLVKDRAAWVAITRQDFAQVKDPICLEPKDVALQSLSEAGGVFHEFNNSLQLVLLDLEMLLALPDLPREARALLFDIKETSQHSADLTAQLLAFARRQMARPQALDLNDATAQVLPALRTIVGASVAIVWQPGTELWPVRLASSQYEQVLVALASNARDALGEHGHLTIATTNVTLGTPERATAQSPAPGEYVRVVVADDGPGMSAEAIEHLFEPFFTTKPVERSTTITIHWPRLVAAENRVGPA